MARVWAARDFLEHPGRARARGAVRVTSSDPAQVEHSHADHCGGEAAATIHVCITCRRPGDPEDFPRPGAALALATACAAGGRRISVRRVRCLANCKRGLSAAIRRDGGWSYVFGDLDLSVGATALIEGARLLVAAPDGLMPWRERPESLKRGLIARLPPILFEDPE